MPNSDDTFGLFNKHTKILTQVFEGTQDSYSADTGNIDSSIPAVLQNFSSVNEAKNWFYSIEAQAVFDECATRIEWSVIDGQKLKYTVAFGTKGDPNISVADDWAGQFESRKNALLSPQGGWCVNPCTSEDSEDHLF